MGIGTFENDKFNFIVAATYVMSAEDWDRWRRAFAKASEILFNASEGQFRFGDIYMIDDNVGLAEADFILHDSGEISRANGTFGDCGAAIHLRPHVKVNVLTTLHELGHSVWDLGEEYAYVSNSFVNMINKSISAPDNQTIPIQGRSWNPNELANMNASATLYIGSNVERHPIISNTATQVVVAPPGFSDLPTNSSQDWVWYQRPAECSAVGNDIFCIMETPGHGAGTLAPDGTWTPNANPVTEFCSQGNHDPDRDTQQHDKHGKSCWQTIVEHPLFSNYVAPDPAGGALPAGLVPPEFFVLDRQPRFSLVLDRSGSMSQDNKITDAKYGAIYWIEHTKASGDLLSVAWYNENATSLLDLTQVDHLTTAQENALIQEVNDLVSGGNTSLLAGLQDGVAQLSSPPNRSAVQAIVLLTDGKHNTPPGTSATDIIPELKANMIRVYTLGVGEPNRVHMPPLEALAEQTCGLAYAVGDNEPSTIQSKLIEINAHVRGGIITSFSTVLLEPQDEGVKSQMHFLHAEFEAEKVRPRLEYIADLFGLDLEFPRDELLPDDFFVELEEKAPMTGAVMEVETGCRRVTFSIAYAPDQDVWLYLIDPDNNFVDMNDPAVNHVISNQAPHEFAIVENPIPGTWKMIMVRATEHGEIKLQAIAGAENPRLQVFGSASSDNPLGESVLIKASARWGDELSGLSVSADIRSPSGEEHWLVLDDSLAAEPDSGEYLGTFSPNETGRYTGKIIISNRGQARIAQPLTRILHSTSSRISTASDAPDFQRVIPIQFYVGTPPTVPDEEPQLGMRCFDLDQLPPDRMFGVGELLHFNSENIELRPFQWDSGQMFDGGFCRFTGFELEINNINFNIQVKQAVPGLILQFGHYGGNLNVEINGEFVNIGDFSEIDGQFIGGVLVSITSSTQERGQLRGRLVLDGEINQFALGGQELFVNNICTVLDSASFPKEG